MRQAISRAVLSALALGTAVACNANTAREAEPREVKQGLQDGPDLVVAALSAPPSATPYTLFPVTATVCNQGNVGVDAEVLLVLSEDSDLSPVADMTVANLYLGYLSPGACATSTVEVTASYGRWYVGALADPNGLQSEVDEGNNTRLSAPLGVGYGPDFIVTGVKGPTSARPGDPFTAQVTVCNQGNQSDIPTVELYLSADAIIQPGPGPQSPDMLVAGTTVGSLNPGQCTTVPMTGYVSVPAPGTEGPYHLGAVVDPGNTRPELIEDNNTNADFVLGVGNRADFVITDVKGPASVQPGQALTAQVTVCNQGTQSDSTDVGLFLSADANIHPPFGPTPVEDSVVGMAYVGLLAPGQCVTVPVSGNAYPPPPGTEGAWYLGAFVDPGNTRIELIEDNNANAGYVLGVGSRPDFVVTSVKGPASVRPGDPFTAQVTVCNQGTQPGDTDVVLLLSADTTLRPPGGPTPPEDTIAGATFLSTLNPGQCTTVSLSCNAYLPPPGTEGAWHLGAIADPMSNRVELVEDNNTNVGYVVGVGNRPDFVVTSVKGPTSVGSGQPLTAQITVCNQGTLADSTDVGLILSADATIRKSTGPGQVEDSAVGFTPVGTLAPGQCTTVSLSGNAYPPPPGADGAYYLGAIVDPDNTRVELLEDNNTNAGSLLGVGSRPDFVVTSVKGPSSVQSGQALAAQVTVCNQGTQPGDTDVGVFLSADATIRTSTGTGPVEDAPVGFAPVGTLSPSQCRTVSVSGSAYLPPPGNDGAYRLGAVVDPGNTRVELIEDNNTNADFVLGVGKEADFIVTSVKGPPSVLPGQSLTAQVTVCNQGTWPDNTDVGVFLSADATIVPSTGPWPGEDAPVGFATVGTLDPGQCATVTVTGYASLPAPGTEGAYRLGAFVDPSRQRLELQEENNANAGYVMGVGNQPDFIVTSVKGPASVVPGQSLSAVVTVCNQGTRADTVAVDLYLSADAIIRPTTGQPPPPEDARVGGFSVGNALNPGQCVAVPVTGNAYPPSPGTDGVYFLGAVVDPGNTRVELIEDNNTHSGYVLGVGNRPDFVVTEVTGPYSVASGQSLTAQVTVCNQGTQSGNSYVTLLLSGDDLIGTPGPSGSTDDIFVGRVNVGTLNPGQCTTVPVSGSVNPSGTSGAYFLGAQVDPGTSGVELNYANNTSSGYRLGVGKLPDFVVTAVTGPDSVAKGATFTASFTVCNRGQFSQAANVSVYLSADGTIRVPAPPLPPEDYLLATVANINVAFGTCVSRSVSVTLPSTLEGGYTLGAVVAPANAMPELIEDNNTLAGSRLGVGDQPDFVITAVTSTELTVKPGMILPTSTTVCNRGRLSGVVDVELYLFASPATAGTQAPASPEAFFLGRMTGLSLAAGACLTRPLTGSVPGVVLGGTYFLGAVADPLKVRTELIEDNNVLTGSRIGVGAGPELVVTSMTAPTSVRLGATFTASVVVCNRGSLTATTDVDLFLSADTTIRLPTPPRAPEDTFLGTVSGVALAAGQCATRSLSVRATVPSTGGYYVGAAVDPRFTIAEFFEDNNTQAFGFISVTP
ncbi:hypothetical protein JY651_17970 [Pyxidicoccus parkwayensis]|uniref:CARDB domain-containing protein n=1 Tax=Pyxidicoccus parkwayensis TaxID=2813578 RepID=A0ABX7P8D1_9BACT|nr:CARDB domain-containing protein [Pyxidicoccus parkwaysis]QSQ26699.1 hypothetical protein JY651_17970 [Pyxidicoccus parkwaysis]